MFDHFTFGAQAQNLYYTPEEEVDSCASPTDTSCIPPPQQAPTSSPFPDQSTSSPAINDLLSRLTSPTFAPEEKATSVTLWTDTLLCPAFEEAYAENCELSYISTRRGLTKLQSRTSEMAIPPHSRPSSSGACRRLQRQLNTQLQSCTDHVKDITTLVEDMIATNKQCTVHPAPITTPSPPPPALESFPSPPETSSSSTIPAILSPATPPPPPAATPSDEGFDELSDNEALEVMLAERERAIEAGRSRSLSALDSTSTSYTSLQDASGPNGIRKFGVVRYGLYKSFSAGKPDTATMMMNEDVTNEFMPRGEGRVKIRSMPRMRVRRREKKEREKRKTGDEGALTE